MGIVRTHLRLANDARPELEEIDAEALVDTGALHLCIPEHIALQLQLRTVEPREVILADGKPHQVPYVSPVRIELLGRHSVCGALVLGSEVLLGALAMEDMDLVIEPARRKVSVNPRAPNIPMSIAMGNRARGAMGRGATRHKAAIARSTRRRRR
jgi:clan AA aspartic protease